MARWIANAVIFSAVYRSPPQLSFVGILGGCPGFRDSVPGTGRHVLSRGTAPTRVLATATSSTRR